jgi:hypothetical protein
MANQLMETLAQKWQKRKIKHPWNWTLEEFVCHKLCFAIYMVIAFFHKFWE